MLVYVGKIIYLVGGKRMKRLKFVALATMITGAMALAACSSDNAKDTKDG